MQCPAAPEYAWQFESGIAFQSRQHLTFKSALPGVRVGGRSKHHFYLRQSVLLVAVLPCGHVG